MTASELSEQIREHVERGEFSQAVALLMTEWKAASDFGVAHCDLPEYPGIWVRFKTSGYPFRLRREWDAADANEALALLVPHLDDWNVMDVDGQVVHLDGERGAALFDDVDDGLVWWLMRTFVNFWLIELPQPRKNSSLPSVSMSSTAAVSLLS